MSCKAITNIEKAKLQRAKEACDRKKGLWNEGTCRCKVAKGTRSSLDKIIKHKNPRL